MAHAGTQPASAASGSATRAYPRRSRSERSCRSSPADTSQRARSNAGDAGPANSQSMTPTIAPSRHAHTTRLRHDVLLIDEPRHRLTRDPDDHGHVVGKLDAVCLVQAATGEANEPLDLASADGTHHRIDDRTGRRRHQVPLRHPGFLSGGHSTDSQAMALPAADLPFDGVSPNWANGTEPCAHESETSSRGLVEPFRTVGRTGYCANCSDAELIATALTL